MRSEIWEAFVSLAFLPVVFVLFLVLGLSVLFVLLHYVPFLVEYFGILLIILLTVPCVVFVLYMKRKERRKDA